MAPRGSVKRAFGGLNRSRKVLLRGALMGGTFQRPEGAVQENADGNMLTLAGTRHFAILHGTGGGGGVRPPPRVWLLSELELRLKNQRVACHETKPLTPLFKVLGQTVTSEVRSMTRK